MHDQLYHHGIKGQRWGVRRFQNIDGSLTPAGRERYWNDERKAKAKKIAKTAAIIAGVALVAYGGYRLSQCSSRTGDLGESIANDVLAEVGGMPIPKVGRAASEIDRAMVGSINVSNHGRDGEMNCAHTSMAYILNSMYGRNVSAMGFSGVDEASGLKTGGRDRHLFDAVFKGISHIKPDASESFDESVKRIPTNSTGVLFIKGSGISHFLNYERDASGALTLVDSQQRDARTQIMTQDSPAYRFLTSKVFVSDIMDFSNASVNDGAESILRRCVKGGR